LLVIRIAILGLLTVLTPAYCFAAGSPPYAIAIEWGAGARIARIDLGSGVVTYHGEAGVFALNAMAISPAGEVFAAGNSPTLYRIDPHTGISTGGADLGDNIGLGTSIRGLAFSPAGVLFAINGSGPFGAPDELYTIDIATGAASLVGSVGYPGVQGLDFAADGTLYGWDVGGAGLVTINPATAASADVNPLVGDVGAIQALAFAPDGRLYGATNGPSTLVEINRTTGVATLVGPATHLDIRGLVIVPEPSRIALAVIPAVAVARSRRHSVRR
jgi:hypothetical protein